MLSRYYCARGHYFNSLYLDSGEPLFHFQQHMVDDFQEPHDWLELITGRDIDDPVFVQGVEIRSFCPILDAFV